MSHSWQQKHSVVDCGLACVTTTLPAAACSFQSLPFWLIWWCSSSVLSLCPVPCSLSSPQDHFFLSVYSGSKSSTITEGVIVLYLLPAWLFFFLKVILILYNKSTCLSCLSNNSPWHVMVGIHYCQVGLVHTKMELLPKWSFSLYTWHRFTKHLIHWKWLKML